jgi:molybdopterin molybdotransferase
LRWIPAVLDTQQIPIEQAKGRCLAEAIISPAQVPPHTNSAVDGYAIRSSDLAAENASVRLKIQSTVLAGQFTTESCRSGKWESIVQKA